MTQSYKSISKKSISKKSISRRSVSRKSVSRRSVSRKSVSRRSISNKKEKARKIISMLSNLKKFTLFYKNLTSNEKEALQNYKYTGYIKINKYLYDGIKINDLYISNFNFLVEIKKYFSKDTVNFIDIKSINPGNIKPIVELYVNKTIIEQINTIDKIFQSSNIQKLQGNEILYRGTGGHSITTKNSRVGNEVIFKNYISTSLEQSISENFLFQRNSKKEKVCCMYIFHNMKDVPFIYLPWQIKNSDKLSKKTISQTFSDEFEFLLPRGLKFKIIKKELVDFKTTWEMDQSVKKISFDKFAKFITSAGISIDKMNLSKMNDEDFRKLYDKISNKILTYHLEYISQEPVEVLPPFVYNSKINLHIDNASSVDKPKGKLNMMLD